MLVVGDRANADCGRPPKQGLITYDSTDNFREHAETEVQDCIASCL